jgi:hypothetical protein
VLVPRAHREKQRRDADGEVRVVRREGRPVRRRPPRRRPPQLQRVLRAAGGAAQQQQAGDPRAERERQARRRRPEPALLQRLVRGVVRPHPRRSRAAEAVRQRHQLVRLLRPPLREPQGLHAVLRRAGRHRGGAGDRRRRAAAEEAPGGVQGVRRGGQAAQLGAARRRLDQE